MKELNFKSALITTAAIFLLLFGNNIRSYAPVAEQTVKFVKK